jgi:ferrous-iron efflux pump FieF
VSAGLAQRAAIASVCTAIGLMALKAYAAWTTGSVAMLGSLADSALDIIASGVTLFAVRMAAQPADEQHRFGHGKAEALAALFQVAVIAISAFAILIRAIERFSSHDLTAHAEDGIVVSLIALVATGLLIVYQRRVIAATGSVAIGADRVHYSSDLMLNGAVIVALVLDQYAGVTGADPFFGIAIALWLFFGAWRASSHAIDQLMDKEWPEEKRRRFVEIAARHPELKGLHDLRTRTSGARDFVQFHVWMDPRLTIAAAHDAMEEVEHRLAAEFPDTEILIHIDPEGHVDEPDNPLAEVDEVERLKEAP